MIIRTAAVPDMEEIANIYEYYVLETAISFEQDAPNTEQMVERFYHKTLRCPWLVCEQDGAVIGYAYAGEFRERAAYQWDVELSVYVDKSAHNRGAGKALYKAMFAILRELGYCLAYSVITVPNDASVGFHRAMGFSDAGVWHSAGYKLDAWHDVLLMEKPLVEQMPDDPEPPTPFKWLSEQRVDEIIDEALNG